MRAPALLAALTLSVAFVGCGDDPFEPTVENVAGSYEATTLTLTTAEGTVDLLDAGASAEVTLETDGTTSGRLFVPEGGEGGEDLDEDLEGTWELDGDIVTFDQTADTFIRDAEFTAEENRLSGEETFTGATIEVVLTKTD
jgi:hypothetical protein